jgi:hypothetical protein
MDPQRRVQVVLGEAERTDGLLRFILEGEGFDIIGLASDDDELARVLRGARPEVVVLDGGISAPAALEARDRVEGASLVVVWPDGVAAVIAEERVDPSSSISDLGNAVRRAAKAAELARVGDTTIRVPEAQATRIHEESRAEIRSPDVRNDPPLPTRSRGRRSQLLIAATTWVLALTALTAIAIALPNALDPSPRHGGGRPSPGVSVKRPDETTDTSQRAGDTKGAATCDDLAAPETRTDRSRGSASPEPVRAQGCPPDRPQGQAGTKGKGGDRPDDPGSQANGKGPPNPVPGDGRGGTDGSQETDGDGLEHGNAGNAGKGQEHGLAGDAGRAENGNPG